MTSMSTIENRVFTVIEENTVNFNGYTLTKDTKIKDVGDHLAQVEISNDLNDEFSVDAVNFEDFETVGDLITYIEVTTNG